MSLGQQEQTHVHFIGIGGIGMSGLAEILLTMGYKVSGSDLSSSFLTKRLEQFNAQISIGHSACHIAPSVDCVVHSAAVKPDNVELQEAHARGLPVISRGELLADIVRLKKHAIAVAGSHGKTTTTSLIHQILETAFEETTAIVGGVLLSYKSNALWGQGEHVVVETDEHDGSFLKLSPTICVVTNIDQEHIEYYGSFENLRQAFYKFIEKVPFYGFSVLCADDDQIKTFLPFLTGQLLLYSVQEGSTAAVDLQACHVSCSNTLLEPWTCFEVHNFNSRLGSIGCLGQIYLPCLGQHNVSNALAAIAVSLGLGVPWVQIEDSLKHFHGVKRRMEITELQTGVTLIEDYAHHPTELKVVLNTLLQLKTKKLTVIFQPHLYSRTQNFAKQFIEVFNMAGLDSVLILDIYPAREQPLPGVNAQWLVKLNSDSIENAHPISYCDSFETALDHVAQMESGDCVVVLGAGDIHSLAQEIRNKWQQVPSRATHGVVPQALELKS